MSRNRPRKTKTDVTKNLVNEAKNCGICYKNFVKSEYKLLCAGLCSKWVCQDCSSLSQDEICKLYEKKKAGFVMDVRKQPLLESQYWYKRTQNGGDSKYQYTVTDVIALIKQNHNSLSNELKSFKKELSSLPESIQFMSNLFDELQKENKEIKRWPGRNQGTYTMQKRESVSSKGRLTQLRKEEKYCKNECSKTGTGEDRRNGIQYYRAHRSQYSYVRLQS
ncbi:hypothetical protein HHI36_016765 [Cryptolaemus montrouzieri]|uniref:Uncharacterized protein n=1 Tax=Cryptolaemus montrouzieri TaxID=559131 RepID=A0ABD2NLE6_9CUCU